MPPRRPRRKRKRQRRRKPRRNPICLAREWQQLLDSGVAASRADLARKLGVSRARVTQVLKRLTVLDADVSAPSPVAVEA